MMDTREGESFTASADCPSCGHLAVHWIDSPRLRPEVETPLQQGLRVINESMWAMSLYSPGPYVPRHYYDKDGNTVIRVCVKCGYRWGQR